MMAHSNDVVTDLNARARAARLALSGEPIGAERPRCVPVWKQASATPS